MDKVVQKTNIDNIVYNTVDQKAYFLWLTACTLERGAVQCAMKIIKQCTFCLWRKHREYFDKQNVLHADCYYKAYQKIYQP